MNAQNANNWIHAALIAALNAQPQDPGLTDEELRGLVVGRDGIGEGAFFDALRQLHGGEWDEKQRRVATHSDVHLLMIASAAVPDEIRPRVALNSLADAFDALANEQGQHVAAERTLLHARCHPVASIDVDRAIALLTAAGTIKKTKSGFERVRPWVKYQRALERDSFLATQGEPAKTILPDVRDVFARRAGQHAPSDPPSDRFGRFLAKQGWTGFASWWSQNLVEMRRMIETREPTSICVLCGALLEAALVAIAKPAKDAGEWRQKFLLDPPEKWKLGELIEQARTSGVFSDDQFAHAKSLMNARNRIHAGRFAAGDAFNPPYTNAHEARAARDHLEMLLAAILGWKVVQART